MYIKSVRIISNNICYGPIPEMEDEVEQHLTISSSGRVWFSARNYEQYCLGKVFRRKKQVNIGDFKATFLISLIDKLEKTPLVTDCGYYDLTVRYEDGSSKRFSGSLIGNDYVPCHGDIPESVTKLLRKYISIPGLWGFGGNMLSP